MSLTTFCQNLLFLFTGIKVNDTTFLPVNLTIIDIGNTNETQYPISVAAINSGDFDFFFFAAVRHYGISIVGKQSDKIGIRKTRGSVFC